MELESRRRVDVLGRERRAALAVHEHHARPILLSVLRLRRAEELGVLLRHVVVLHHLDRIAVVAQPPELGDVVEDEHVAIREYGPPAVVAQPGREETGEGKIGRLQGITRPAVYTLQLGEPDRRNRHRLGRALVDRVRENAECDSLARVVSDEDLDQRDFESVEVAA